VTARNAADATAEPHFFDRLLSDCKRLAPVEVAVAAPHSQVALLGAIEAAESALIRPILVGSALTIREIAERAHVAVSEFEFVPVDSDQEAAAKCVELCRAGRARALMKGSLHTDTLMHEVLRQSTGLCGSRRMSHIFVATAPAYPRPLFLTDAAINIRPTLEEKADIVRNAIELAHVLGVATPHVALLSALETINSKIQATVDAAALCKMADRGQIAGAILDGPLGFDAAVSEAAALIKQLRSPVAGKADILVAPDLEAGNILAKELEYLGGAELAGIVLGARVPIVLTSRADLPRARLVSCALAVWWARRGESRS